VRVLFSWFCGGVGFLWNSVAFTVRLSSWLAYNASFALSCICVVAALVLLVLQAVYVFVTWRKTLLYVPCFSLVAVN
jgi:hypothetical protein